MGFSTWVHRRSLRSPGRLARLLEAPGPSAGFGPVDYVENRATSGPITHSDLNRARISNLLECQGFSAPPVPENPRIHHQIRHHLRSPDDLGDGLDRQFAFNRKQKLNHRHTDRP